MAVVEEEDADAALLMEEFDNPEPKSEILYMKPSSVPSIYPAFDMDDETKFSEKQSTTGGSINSSSLTDASAGLQNFASTNEIKNLARKNRLQLPLDTESSSIYPSFVVDAPGPPEMIMKTRTFEEHDDNVHITTDDSRGQVERAQAIEAQVQNECQLQTEALHDMESRLNYIDMALRGDTPHQRHKRQERQEQQQNRRHERELKRKMLREIRKHRRQPT